MSTKAKFYLMVVLAFASALSFVTDNSAWADRIHAGYGFIIAGIVFGLAAIGVVINLVGSQK